MKFPTSDIRCIFRVPICGLGVILAVATTQAQLTNNPWQQLTTNVTQLSSIGTYGFGIALLGYPLPSPGGPSVGGFNGAAVSDTTSSQDSSHFYVAAISHDGFYYPELLSYRVQTEATNQNTLTVTRNWVAGLDRTNVDVNARSAFGSFGLGGVSQNGSIAIRVDGYRGGVNPVTSSGVYVLDANTASLIIMTNFSNPGLVFLDPLPGNIVLPPAIGQTSNLVALSDFASSQYVARLGTGFPVNSNGIPTGQQIDNRDSRGVLAINDTARVMAILRKAGNDNGDIGGFPVGIDCITHLTLYTNYTDTGDGVSFTNPVECVFGDSTQSIINYNGINFFGRTAFQGPGQISINDHGNLAFPVGLDVTNQNLLINGTRNSFRTGILYHPANGDTNDFRLVTDNQDPALFYVPDPNCTFDVNIISSAALDNFGNVYFEAAYASAAPCIPSAMQNALYQAVANNPTNPTAWTVRTLFREGDMFTNQISGEVFQVSRLNYLAMANGTNGSSQSINATSFGPAGINRTQLPGHTMANTKTLSPFVLGGLVVQARVYNLTQSVNTDALLYLAPYAVPAPSLQAFRSGNNVVIAWPAPSADFTLQANSDLTTTNWVTVTNTPTVTNGQKQVMLSPNDASRNFFRLVQP